MRRQSREIINTVADVKENVKGIIEEDGESYSLPVPKDKIGRVDESKAAKVSKMENLSCRSSPCVQKLRVKCNKYVERKSHQKSQDDTKLTVNENLSVRLKGNLIEPSLSSLTDKLSPFSEGRPTFVADANCLVPNTGKADIKSNAGTSEKLMKKPNDFASITIAEFGISSESFTAKHSVEKSMALKFRRRSAIGVRGSPENNSLIRYLAQQRRNRTEDASTEASHFQHRNVGSLKARNRRKQHEPSQLSKELISECKSVAYRETLKEKLTRDKSTADIQICKILSPPEEVPNIETATVSKEILCTPPNIIDSGSLSLEVIPLTGTPKTSHSFSSACISEEVESNARSQLSRKKVTFAEELSLEIFDETMPPITPLQKGNLPSSEQSHKGSSYLQSVLKKRPVKLLMESVKERVSNPTGMEGNEPLESLENKKSCEELQTDRSKTKTVDKANVCSSEKPMKRKKVTFGEDLSPEVFDNTLPANTPLHKGATPVSYPRSPNNSPSTVISPIKKPLSQPNFDDCSDDDDDAASCIAALPADLPLGVNSVTILEEYVKPLQECVAVPETIEEVDSFDNKNSCTRITRSSTKRKQYINISEETGFSISTGITAKKAQDNKNPRNSKIQRRETVNKSAPKRTAKVKCRDYRGKKGRKKVEKSLYGRRAVASKKPLLSPIPEIPEVVSSAPSSPNTPKTDYSKSSKAHIGSMNEIVEEKKVIGRIKRKVPITNKCPNTKELCIVEARITSGMECQSSDNGLDSTSTINIGVVNVHKNFQTENELGSSLTSLDQKECDICVSNQTSEEDHINKTSYQQSEPSLMREHASPVTVKSNFHLPLPNTFIQESKSISPFDTFDNKEREKERDVLIENECVLESDPSNNTEVLKELEFLNLQDVVSSNTLTECPIKDFPREQTAHSDANVNFKRVSRKGRGTIACLSDIENLHHDALGNNLCGSFSNGQEPPSVPQIENDSEMFSDLYYSIERSFMKVTEDGKKKVRRSMRLQKKAENEGLAWIKIPIKSRTNSLSESACKSKGTMYASVFKESENIHRRQENGIPFAALRKEKSECALVAGGSCKTRRRSMYASTSQETKNITQTQKKRRGSFVYNDKSYQKESEVDVPFEKHPNA